MGLGVDTALEEVQKLVKEIADLKKEILDNKALGNAREALERLERSMKDFVNNTQTFKLDKFARDISFYDKKVTYPCLSDEYYKQDSRGRFSTRVRGGLRQFTTVSESSGSTGGGESDNEQLSMSTAVHNHDLQQLDVTSGHFLGPTQWTPMGGGDAHGTEVFPENEVGAGDDTEAGN
ncbi:hypothetical protein NDU88_000416 [Pleurodeles waltl]|uniref:Uncharacterized protein n=1 Tax=Pleurodeles waltl TaxID=8319 RepID=A0AAV7TFT8_PLEWA|nr:hypothetical protein NDU88_000416 [Pleurodeles waltl]